MQEYENEEVHQNEQIRMIENCDRAYTPSVTNGTPAEVYTDNMCDIDFAESEFGILSLYIRH